MTVLIIFGVLLGVATASRLRAITVVPVMALMMATIVLFGTALGEMVWWLSVRAVGEYLARWGFTPQKAARRAYECDDEAVKLWLQREYPKIVARAKREKADICWGDETGVRSDESRHCGYSPCGQTAIIKIPARRKSPSLIAAVTNQGKVRFMIYAGGITPQRLILFSCFV